MIFFNRELDSTLTCLNSGARGGKGEKRILNFSKQERKLVRSGD
jgi:hypothetical protein